MRSKKFLLVLDDVWNENHINWQWLLELMRKVIEGSVILISTRSQEVAELANNVINSTGPIYYLDGLEKNIYWKFFKSCAFGSEVKTKSYSELKKIGKEISEKLNGSPFGAKTIGSLLKVKLDVGHWSNIRDSKMWKLIRDKHDILPILQLSYHYLPSVLKKCLSFCSLYPKGHMFTKTELSKFWIMHDFIIPLENVEQEQNTLTEGYINELVRRYCFQKGKGCYSDQYMIHDLMHEICQSITEDECFCLEDEHQKENIPLNIRHFLVFKKEILHFKEIELGKYNKLLSVSVASACYYPGKTIRNWCKELTSIRSLSLVRCRLKKLPANIGKLKHLQYLDISFSMVEVLPKSFCSLYNLKYLNMEGCENYTTNFPEGSDKLVSLQIFYFPKIGMPLEGPVNNLAKTIIAKDRTINLIIGGTIIDRIQNLKHISIHGSLRITGLEVVPSRGAAEEAELNKKPLIKKLELSWSRPWERGHSYDHSVSNELHDEEVLEGLCPHPNLEELWINFYGRGNLAPSWMNNGFLPNLVQLVFWSCELTNLENCLRPEQLPPLKYLHVRDCKELMSLPIESFERFEFLEDLTILDCPKLTCPNLDAMVLPPSLKCLHLQSCGDLQMSIPSCLQNLSSLRTLILEDLPLLVSIPPEATSHLKSLSHLSVENCAELKSLGGLHFLTSVKKRHIHQCPKLQEAEELPKNT